MRSPTISCVTTSLLFIVFAACDAERTVRCGQGTELIAGECLPVLTDLDGGTADARVPSDEAASDCGDRALLVDGVCRGVQPVGAACERGSECDTQTCMPDADGFPGGYCSIPNCNELRPCTVGSHCVYASKREASICLAFCSGETPCRDGYVCQPLYDGEISVCAPACREDADCPDQTRCDTDSGECVLRECDPAQRNACGDGRVCFADSRGITQQGGVCLTSCDPASNASATNSDSQCQGQDVCQPLPEDPAHKGVCAPPVCQQTSDCQVGAVCKEQVCQPPARCDAKGACADRATSCVGGPAGQCLTKCANDAACTAIQSGLVCAKGVAESAVCMPVGSYPGSACRRDSATACDSVSVNGMTVAMRCENGSCLPECGTGGDALCKKLSATLSCASGVFARPMCLPSGSYPGGPCAGDTCSEVEVAAGKRTKLLCKAGQCLLDCGAAAVSGGDPEAFCRAVDASLTCATAAFPDAAVCLPEGSYPGGPCAHGMCSDYAGRAQLCHDDRCVPACDPDDDDSCSAIAPTLTCAQGVLAQAACLPTGSYPGSPCAGPNRDQCARDLNGVADIDMQCLNGTCAIGCDEGDKWSGYGEALCRFANPALTCAQAAGSVCVQACVDGACPRGFSCLDPGTAPAHENACLPNGSFLGADCASGRACRGSPMLVCSPGDNPKCAAGCDMSNGQSNANNYCTQVGNQLGTGFNNCAMVASDVHICIKQ